MDTYIVLCIQVTFLATLQAQAPGDGSSTCQNAPFTKPPYPNNIVPLMDSYDYLELTVAMGGPWNTLDVDRDTRTWTQSADRRCRQVPSSCSYNLASGQNNWLFTQHINTTVNGVALSQVVVRVNFSLNGCPTGGSCQQSFLLQMYQTQNIISTGSIINTANYAAFTGSRVTVGSNPSGTIVDTQDITVPLGAIGGMYLAAQDTSTCVSINHLTVFYYICPQQVVNFITYPVTVTNGGITQLACVSGASVVGVQAPLATCGSQGVWGAPTGTCSCNPGYTNVDQTCQTCPPGTYKSAQGSSVCLPCPSNSNNSVNGSSQCPCLQGYYRPAGYGADSGCIATPSLTPVIVGVVAVLILVGVLLSVLTLVIMLKHTSKNARLQRTAVTFLPEGGTTALQSTQPVEAMHDVPCSPAVYEPISMTYDQPQPYTQPAQSVHDHDAMSPDNPAYQGLSTELILSPSMYDHSTKTTQSIRHKPSSPTTEYEPMSLEHMFSPPMYENLQSTQPVQSRQNAPSADTVYQRLSTELILSSSTYDQPQLSMQTLRSKHDTPILPSVYEPLSTECVSTYKHPQPIAEPVQSIYDLPSTDAAYQRLSKELILSPSAYENLSSAQQVQSRHGAPSADAGCEPLPTEFTSSPSSYMQR